MGVRASTLTNISLCVSMIFHGGIFWILSSFLCSWAGSSNFFRISWLEKEKRKNSAAFLCGGTAWGWVIMGSKWKGTLPKFRSQGSIYSYCLYCFPSDPRKIVVYTGRMLVSVKQLWIMCSVRTKIQAALRMRALCEAGAKLRTQILLKIGLLKVLSPYLA